jgi:hypothetical protein
MRRPFSELRSVSAVLSRRSDPAARRVPRPRAHRRRASRPGSPRRAPWPGRDPRGGVHRSTRPARGRRGLRAPRGSRRDARPRRRPRPGAASAPRRRRPSPGRRTRRSGRHRRSRRAIPAPVRSPWRGPVAHGGARRLVRPEPVQPCPALAIRYPRLEHRRSLQAAEVRLDGPRRRSTRICQRKLCKEPGIRPRGRAREARPDSRRALRGRVGWVRRCRARRPRPPHRQRRAHRRRHRPGGPGAGRSRRPGGAGRPAGRRGASRCGRARPRRVPRHATSRARDRLSRTPPGRRPPRRGGRRERGSSSGRPATRVRRGRKASTSPARTRPRRDSLGSSWGLVGDVIARGVDRCLLAKVAAGRRSGGDTPAVSRGSHRRHLGGHRPAGG